MAQSDAGNSTPLETKHRRHWPVWVAGLVLFGAMAVSSWQLWFARQAYYSDADTIKQPADTAVVRDILWQPPQRLAELINTLGDIGFRSPGTGWLRYALVTRYDRDERVSVRDVNA